MYGPLKETIDSWIIGDMKRDRNYLLPPPVLEDLDASNREPLERRMADLHREHYVKKEQIIDLFNAEQEEMIPLNREGFRVFELIKVITDKYSFIHFEKNQYSKSPEARRNFLCKCKFTIDKKTAKEVQVCPPNQGWGIGLVVFPRFFTADFGWDDRDISHFYGKATSGAALVSLIHQ